MDIAQPLPAPRARLIPAIEPAQPFRNSSPLLDDQAALRARLAEDGYLFLPGFLPQEPLLRARRAILGLCRDAGWLAPGSALDDGIASPTHHGLHEGMPAYNAVYRQVVRLAEFNACSALPELLAWFGGLFAGPPFAHPRNIARIAFPGGEPTQPHQDWHYIAGTQETYTCWIPTADVPAGMGGLAVLPGSHRRGPLAHRPTVGAGGMGVDPADLGTWTGGDFRRGDLLLFHSLTVHGARAQRDHQRIRLSFDMRFQRAGDAIHPSSLCYHMEDQHRPA